MNLVQTYLDENGYDYYGNAAEDTLVFFVQDADAPEPELGGRNNEAITNLSEETVNGISGGLSSETAALNTETHAEGYKENGKDTSTNFSIGRDNSSSNNEYGDTAVAGSLSTPDTNGNADDFSDSIPKMAEMDSKQTDTKHSTDGSVKV